MKTCLAALLLLFSLDCATAAAPADGFYLQEDGPTAAQVQDQEGRTSFPGARKSLQASVNWFKSTNNDNSEFSLSIAIPREESLPSGRYVLVVGGTGYPIRSTGCCNNNMASMNVKITGDAKAREVARYFNASISYLKHPGHRLRVSFSEAKPSFRRGEEVSVTINITNVGDSPVTIMQNGRDLRGGRNEFYFSAYRNWKPVPELDERRLCSECLSSHIVINPAQTFRDTINLGKWFDFHEAGIYEIHGSYRLTFPDLADSLPFYAWTEYVGGNFSITME